MVHPNLCLYIIFSHIFLLFSLFRCFAGIIRHIWIFIAAEILSQLADQRQSSHTMFRGFGSLAWLLVTVQSKYKLFMINFNNLRCFVFVFSLFPHLYSLIFAYTHTEKKCCSFADFIFCHSHQQFQFRVFHGFELVDLIHFYGNSLNYDFILWLLTSLVLWLPAHALFNSNWN